MHKPARGSAYRLDMFDTAEESARLALQQQAQWERELRALSSCGMPKTGRLLDVGCGTGAPALALAELGFTVTGIDRDRDALAQCSKNITTACGEADNLPFHTASFDVVFSRFAMQHMANVPGALSEMKRILKTGGTICLIDADHATSVRYPEIVGLRSAQEKWFEHASVLGADPAIGRKLPSLLRGLGVQQLGIEILTMHSEQIGRDSFAKIMFGPPLALAENPEEAREEIRSWVENEASFGFAHLFVAVGVVD